jgi:hypothetical protein
MRGYQARGITSGYVFRNEDGIALEPKAMRDNFFNRLEYIKSKRPNLIDSDLEVTEKYGISKSFRRGRTSEATNKGAPLEVAIRVG